MESNIESRVLEVVGQIQPLEEGTSLDAKMSSLNWDSLDIVELITELEEEFDISIGDIEGESLEKGTLGDIVKLVESKAKE